MAAAARRTVLFAYPAADAPGVPAQLAGRASLLFRLPTMVGAPLLGERYPDARGPGRLPAGRGSALPLLSDARLQLTAEQPRLRTAAG
ncbi:hypothetical protein SRB17_24370 [Streptomyces sp. RB17]|uniref:hypothetical protein n=1 Tax=Streptomyces sp. RB17 TaxID=2585197 RepID=UPI00130917DD|nr:hypothetical protein [Streptomyces sp. RB17]MQY34468.1 hypothetical protein [Streptomyces sp. RB17]